MGLPKICNKPWFKQNLKKEYEELKSNEEVYLDNSLDRNYDVENKQFRVDAERFNIQTQQQDDSSRTRFFGYNFLMFVLWNLF